MEEQIADVLSIEKQSGFSESADKMSKKWGWGQILRKVVCIDFLEEYL